MSEDIVVLIGHGGVPTDAPRHLVTELKRLEGARRARGQPVRDERELALDRRLRDWPRTPETDPYKVGLESIATALAPLLAPRRLEVAYNEFCAPSVEDVIAGAASAGAKRVTLLTTMVTPGGSHADREIPEVVEWARARYPALAVDYAWPYDPAHVAAFFAAHISTRFGA